MGVEPTGAGITDAHTVLKTGETTGPLPPPSRLAPGRREPPPTIRPAGHGTRRDESPARHCRANPDTNPTCDDVYCRGMFSSVRCRYADSRLQPGLSS